MLRRRLIQALSLSYPRSFIPCPMRPWSTGSCTSSIDDDGEPFLYLWGASGTGRSHLLQAACHAASDRDGRARYLPLAELGHFPPLMLDEVERLNLVAIDDLDRVVGRNRWEEALFHALNCLRDAGKRLVIAAEASAGEAA